MLIEGNHKDLYLDENISGVTSESVLSVESITVYWDYSNVIRDVNDTFTHNGNLIRLPEGYWTASMISGIRDRYVVRVGAGGSQYCDVIGQLYLEESGSGGFSAYSSNVGYIVNLGKFGTLLGFDKDTVMAAQKKIISQNAADLNRGLKYVTVSCDMVDETRNVDAVGRRSNVIATIPVPTGVDLKRAVTCHHTDTGPLKGIQLQNGCFNSISFDVNTNMWGPYS